jgi:phage shock protein PspC (stress-responsive transcriptional regulator)
MVDLSELRWHLREVRTAERPDERVVGGVCEGLGRHLGVDPMVLRLAFVVLGLANGVGVVLYAVLWSVLPAEGEGPAGVAPRTPVTPTADRALGVGLATFGGTLLVASFGLVVPPGLVWSVAVSALGFSLVWARTSDEERARWMGRSRGRTSAPIDSVPRGRVLVLRAIAGGTLLVVGLAVLFASGGLLSLVGQLGLAVVATGVGVALLLGPWMVRLWRER